MGRLVDGYMSWLSVNNQSTVRARGENMWVSCKVYCVVDDLWGCMNLWSGKALSRLSCKAYGVKDREENQTDPLIERMKVMVKFKRMSWEASLGSRSLFASPSCLHLSR